MLPKWPFGASLCVADDGNETRRSTPARSRGYRKGLDGYSDCRQNQNTFQAFAEYGKSFARGGPSTFVASNAKFRAAYSGMMRVLTSETLPGT